MFIEERGWQLTAVLIEGGLIKNKNNQRSLLTWTLLRRGLTKIKNVVRKIKIFLI